MVTRVIEHIVMFLGWLSIFGKKVHRVRKAGSVKRERESKAVLLVLNKYLLSSKLIFSVNLCNKYQFYYKNSENKQNVFYLPDSCQQHGVGCLQ